MNTIQTPGSGDTQDQRRDTLPFSLDTGPPAQIADISKGVSGAVDLGVAESPQRVLFKAWLRERMKRNMIHSDGDINPFLKVYKTPEEMTPMYTDVLAPYSARTTMRAASEGPITCDHGMEKGFPGYKLHLNVLPDDVVFVSDYLKSNGYLHKYLTNKGQAKNGKIFTIYVGSLNLTQDIAKQISKDLSGKLLMPQITDEIEFAANVVGRFDVKRNDVFGNYPADGVVGIPAAYRTPDGNRRTSKNDAQAEFDASFELTASLYGEYFYGSSD